MNLANLHQNNPLTINNHNKKLVVIDKVSILYIKIIIKKNKSSLIYYKFMSKIYKVQRNKNKYKKVK